MKPEKTDNHPSRKHAGFASPLFRRPRICMNHNSFFPNGRIIECLVMQKTPARKYQVVEEAEIDLVLKCRDSHEFYEQYLKIFPDTKKGLDSISKIWKRRSEFAKKRPLVVPQAETGSTSNREIQALIAEQTKIMSDMAALTKENLEVSRQILSALAHQNRILTGHHEEKPKDSAHAAPLPKPPVQKKVPEKQTPIMVGS
jgi:hypothetical protein